MATDELRDSLESLNHWIFILRPDSPVASIALRVNFLKLKEDLDRIFDSFSGISADISDISNEASLMSTLEPSRENNASLVELMTLLKDLIEEQVGYSLDELNDMRQESYEDEDEDEY